MKSINTIQILSRLGRILSKIAFIFAVIGCCGCAAGIISLSLGGGDLIQIGGVTLHGLIENDSGVPMSGAMASLSGWLIVCVGEAVLARFAEGYFRRELEAGTPFTHSGAKELFRLGILALTIPTGCAVAASIAEGIVAGFLDAAKNAAMDLYFNLEPSLMLGIFFLMTALLCRYGADIRQD